MTTELNLEQALDATEQVTRQQGETLKDFFSTEASVLANFNQEKAYAIGRMKNLFHELLTREIDSDYLDTLGYEGIESRGVALCLMSGIFIHRNVRIRVELDWKRIGEFWLIGLDSESVRRCDQGELMETLIQTFAQIRFNEKAAIANQTIE